MSKVRALKNTHTPNKKRGMGDSYGTGVRNPIGKPKDVFNEKAVKAKNIGKPPKSLA